MFFKRLGIILTTALLSACAVYQMPHGLGEAHCDGDCDNGLGTLRSKYIDLEYRGRWSAGRPDSGRYQINYNGSDLYAVYNQGRLVEGTKFYPHANFELDYFTGQWQSYYDPFSQKTIFFPQRGIYHSLTGATLTGEFYAIPSRGILKSLYERNPDTAMNAAFANLIFIGKLSYKGREEITTLARRGYSIGQPLMSGEHGSLQPSDAGMLAAFEQELLGEQRDQQQARSYAAQNKFDFSKVIAIAATMAATSYGLNSGLTVDGAAYLGSGTYNLVADGDGAQLAELDQHIEFEQRKELAQQQVQVKVNEIEQDYAPPVRPAKSRVAKAAVQNARSAEQKGLTNRVAAKQQSSPERVSVDIETSGKTDMYFPYKQSLDLAQTKALNNAYALCRSDYNGRLKSDSGTLAKKNCVKHASRDEFKCTATMIFVCERR